MKTCRKCKVLKPSIDFYSGGCKDGLASKCKACVLLDSKSRYTQNRSVCTNQAINWQKNNPDKRAASRKKSMLNVTNAWSSEHIKNDIRDNYLQGTTLASGVLVPLELIELFRWHILIKRTIKEMKNESH